MGGNIKCRMKQKEVRGIVVLMLKREKRIFYEHMDILMFVLNRSEVGKLVKSYINSYKIPFFE